SLRGSASLWARSHATPARIPIRGPCSGARDRITAPGTSVRSACGWCWSSTHATHPPPRPAARTCGWPLRRTPLHGMWSNHSASCRRKRRPTFRWATPHRRPSRCGRGAPPCAARRPSPKRSTWAEVRPSAAMPSSGLPDARAPTRTPSCGWQSPASPSGTPAYSGSPTGAASGSRANRPTAGTAPRAAGCGLPGTTAAPTPFRSPRRAARSAPRCMCAPGSCSSSSHDSFPARTRAPRTLHHPWVGRPGTVGGLPFQNVGAYGQEMADTLASVRCLGRDSLGEVVFTRDQCEFVYRGSRFKGRDRDRYVVLDVSLRLRRDILPQIRYAELAQAIGRHGALERLEPGQAVRVVRDTVVELRRRKSMVLDPTDPNARSVGSFFVNPVLSAEAFDELARRRHAAGAVDGIPTFPADGRVKVPVGGERRD